MRKIGFRLKIYSQFKRFRASLGFGIHSPFAYRLVTAIIREKHPYYAYQSLYKKRKEFLWNHSTGWMRKRVNPIKTDQLLFRLVNFKQPKEVIELGTGSGISILYMAAVGKNIHCTTFDEVHPFSAVISSLLMQENKNITYQTGNIITNLNKFLANKESLEFVYFNQKKENRELWKICVDKATSQSLFIIQDIHATKEMNLWWKEIITDEKTILTFDLYNVGLVFFDKSRIKQHYVLRL